MRRDYIQGKYYGKGESLRCRAEPQTGSYRTQLTFVRCHTWNYLPSIFSELLRQAQADAQDASFLRNDPDGDRTIVAASYAHLNSQSFVRSHVVRIKVSIRLQALPRKKLVAARRNSVENRLSVFAGGCN